MQISERLAAFLEGPVWGHGGTRDRENIPASHAVFGVRISPDREHLTALVAEHWTHGLRENLADNGRFAVTLGLNSTHETYQLKGTCTEVLAATAADLAAQDRWVQGSVDEMKKVGAPDQWAQALANMKVRPCVAVTIRIEELYVQTPGPGAGEKVKS